MAPFCARSCELLAMAAPGRYHLVALDGFDGLRGVDVAVFTRLQRVATTVSVTESGTMIDLPATAIAR